MALTVTTDLLPISDCETISTWAFFGAGGASTAIEPDFFAQGLNSISNNASPAGTVEGSTFDNTTGIDFTSATNLGKLVYIWIRSSTSGSIETRAAGGVRVILGSGTTRPQAAAGAWSAWYVDGSDTIVGTDGWKCYVVDPRSTPSLTQGGGVDVTSIRWYGAVTASTATLKGQNFGIDAVRYGRGELRVTGTVTTPGAGFAEISAQDFGNLTNRYGIITEKGGVFYVKGKIIIGHASTDTTFSSQNETVVFETPAYYAGTAQKSIPDVGRFGTLGSDGGASYSGLSFIGGSGTTTIDLGVIVGADGGRSGSTFTCPSTGGLKTKAYVRASNDAMSLSIYGSSFIGFEGGVNLRGTNTVNDDCFGNTFNACGRIWSNMEMRNCTILNSVEPTTNGAFLWDDTTNIQDSSFINNNRAIVFESTWGDSYRNWTVAFTGISLSSNGKDILNLTGGSIKAGISTGGSTPTYDHPPLHRVIPGDPTFTLSGTGWNFEADEFMGLNMGVVIAQNAVTLQLTNVVVGSQCAIIADAGGPEAVGTILMNEAAVSSTVSEPYNYLGDQPIIIRVRRSTLGSTRYFPISSSGTIISTGFSLRIEQVEDTIAATS